MKNQEQKKESGAIYNIKGLSWMLRGGSVTATSSVNSNTSSISHQFKVFKLKDQKKKWKKKINKKFEGVGIQIDNILRKQLNREEPFSIGLKQTTELKHIPHLKNIRKSTPSFEQSNQAPDCYEFAEHTNVNKRIQEFNKKLKTVKLEESEGFPLKHTNSKSSSKKALSTKKPRGESVDQMKSQNYKLQKKLAQINYSNNKVNEAKKLLTIQSKQKVIIDKENEEFFTKCGNWVSEKVEYYKNFDTKSYENQLIRDSLEKNGVA